MKINDTSSKDIANQIIQQYQRGEKVNQAAEPRTVAPSAAEKVDISTLAKDIQKAKAVIAETPDVREERVQELKAQVDKGTYRVDSEKLAQAMVKDSLIDLFA